MNSDVATHMADKIKLLTAALVLVAGIGAFYYYGEQSVLLRVGGLLVVVGVAATISLQTAVGRNAWSFVQEARTEVRKVVWPTRKETLQMSLTVISLVIIMAMVLWGFDSLLAWLVKLLIHRGS